MNKENTTEEIIKRLDDLGKYLSNEHNNNCDQEVCLDAIDKIKSLERWKNDLLSGMYVNCVYCGYRYGPKENTPVSMAEILKEHIEHCPEHPMSKLKLTNEEFDKQHKELIQKIKTLDDLLTSFKKTLCSFKDKIN